MSHRSVTRANVVILVITVAAAPGAVAQFSLSAARAETDQGLSIETLLRATFVGEPNARTSLSPDGKLFVYTLCDAQQQAVIQKPPHEFYTAAGTPTDELGCVLWIVDTQTAKGRRLTGAENSWDPSWSPDGKSLAFYSDREGLARLWVWTVRDGQFRRVGDEPIHGGGWQIPRWTPDSASLLVPLIPQSAGFAAVTTSHGQVPTFGGAWKYDGSTVRVFHANAPGSTEAATGNTPAARATREPKYDSDLAYVNVATGSVKRIGLVLNPSWYGLSPDGKQIAVIETTATTKNSWNELKKLYVIAADGSRRTLLSDVSMYQASWSPDGRYLATDSTTYDAGIPTLQVHFVRVRDGVHTVSAPQSKFYAYFPAWDSQSRNYYYVGATRASATAQKNPVLERVQASDGSIHSYPIDPPYKSLNLGFIQRQATGALWSRGKNTIIFPGMNDITKDAAILGFNPASGKITPLREASEAYLGVVTGGELLDISSDGRTLVMPIQRVDHPTDYYVFNDSLAYPRRLTDINPELSKVAFGKDQVVRWQAPDGTPLAGTLLFPANYVQGKRYPTIIQLYPGVDYSDVLNYFGASWFGGAWDNFEIFATRGYAVLRAQAVVLPDGRIAQGIADSIVSAANKLVEMGIADPNALGITGQSFGGYGSLVVITKTRLFKAAVVVDGPADLPAQFGALEDDAGGGSPVSAGIVESAFKLGGTLWQNTDRYIENSPVFHLDQVKTAVLILHGTEDSRVPVGQGREVYADLSLLGQEVELRQYDGERHGNRAFANDADAAYAKIKWFDDHLKK